MILTSTRNIGLYSSLPQTMEDMGLKVAELFLTLPEDGGSRYENTIKFRWCMGLPSSAPDDNGLAPSHPRPEDNGVASSYSPARMLD